MTQKTAIDVLLHPIRLRIVRAFLGGTELTARRLAEKLDDVPQATLYRHLNHLTEAGALIVTAATPVHGAIERTYRLDPRTGKLSPEDIRKMDPGTHLKYFSVFLASQLEDFGRYMRAGDVNVARDGVRYLQVTFDAAPKEFAGFLKELDALIKRYAQPGPGENRVQRTVSIVTLPERPTKAK